MQWPWCSAGKAVICFLAVARMRSGGLELHNSDTGPALSYPDHCTLCSLPPQSQFLHPPPRPSWPDCARQAPVLGFCCGRVVVKCCCEVLLRSVVAKCCDGRQPRHQDEGRDAGQGGHGQDLPGGEVPQWQVPGRGPGQVHHRGSLWRQVPLISAVKLQTKPKRMFV